MFIIYSIELVDYLNLTGSVNSKITLKSINSMD